jgi:probable phosphoglycerate mutase
MHQVLRMQSLRLSESSLRPARGKRLLSSLLQEVIVVRHGETEWNRELRVQGSTDIALNNKGWAQAQACADALKNEYMIGTTASAPITRIYSSPLSRASDTAWTIAQALSGGGDDVPVSISCHGALQEWNMGALEELRKEEASESFPADWKIFSQWANPYVCEEDASQCLTQGGESMDQVRRRAVQFIEDAVCQTKTNSAGPVICVTHGGVLGQLLRHVAEVGDQPNNMEEYIRPANACISRFAIHKYTKRWEISMWADTSHLVGDDVVPTETNYDAAKKKDGHPKAETG